VPDRARLEWGIVLAAVIAVYLIINLALRNTFTPFGRTYVAQPLLWFALIVGVLLIARSREGGELRFGRPFTGIALLLGGFQVACLLIAGLLSSFGKSPYTHSAYGIFLNVTFFGTALVAFEFVRAYLLSRFDRRRTMLAVVLISLLYTVISIPLTRLTGLDGFTAFPFVGGTMLPSFAENLLASFLAVMGGPLPALAYRGAMECFEWFSPILPSLTWMVKAFVGVLAPVIGMLVVQTIYSEKQEQLGLREAATWKPRSRFSVVSWVVTLALAVVIIWFSSGLLGFRPVVIVSGSMSPAIAVGDVAVVRDVSAESIVEGDVIKYTHGGAATVHRVVEIGLEEGSYFFMTQGDANDNVDARLVYPEDIEGRVSFVLPKIGWLSIGFKNLFSSVF
jgi:signal peptidase